LPKTENAYGIMVLRSCWRGATRGSAPASPSGAPCREQQWGMRDVLAGVWAPRAAGL